MPRITTRAAPANGWRATPRPTRQWTADGYVSDRWLPVSPVSGRLDAFEWRVPLTGMVSAPVIEPEPPAASIDRTRRRKRHIAETLIRRRPKCCHRAGTAKPGPSKLEPKPEPVIPLVHAPDDPGPDAAAETEAAAEAEGNGWRKIFG